jgi:hypothetical protein
MNKKDLDALNELYLSVYDEEQLDEAPVTGFRPVDRFLQGAQAFIQGNPRPTGTVNRQIQTAQQYRDAGGVGAPPPNWKPGQPTKSQPPKPTEKPPVPIKSRGSEANPPSAADARKDEADPRRNPTRAGSPPSRPPAGSSSAPPSRPAPPKPSGPVLSKKDGVEGTGVGADFKARAFTAAEKSRYDKVRGAEQLAKDVSQVAANKKAREKAASEAKPAVGKLGNTSFERRTPTSAELKAAQAAKAGGASPEKALQAAQKTNLPKTGPSPAIPDLKSVNTDLAKFTPRDMNKYPIKTPNPINNTKPSQTMKSSYEWPSAKTIRDIADAYSSIYEAKKVDQDQDGDNDFADVRIARLIASGVSKEEAIRRVRDKSYNEAYVPWDFGPKDKAKAKHTELAARKEAGGSAPKTATRANRIASVAKDMRTTLDKNSAATGTNPARQGLQPATQRHTAAALRGAGGGMTASKVYDVKPLKPASKSPKGGGSSAQGVGSPSGTGRYQVGGGQGYGISGIKLADEFELWVNELVEEGYDLSEYTWEDMFDIYEETQLDEATRMRKELGKEGETATRQELARRSNAYQRSGSVDKTIAAAERGANRTTARNRDESEGDYKTRMQKRSQTLNKLAANRRKSVRSGEGLRGYAAKVEGSDRDLQSARGSARSAGTLTPREKKQLNMEAYEAYEFVVSYLLENNFAETINDANVIIENMSDNWFTQIMEG